MDISSRLRNNLGLKLLSLGIALVIWGTVRNEADPLVARHRPVPVEAVDVSPDLAVAAVDPPQVTVTLLGRNSAFDQLEYSNFRLTASVPQREPGVHTAMLEPEGLPAGLEIRQMSRTMVRVELDTVVTATRPVFVETRGKPAGGFAVAGTDVKPAEVTVTGPSSLVQKVARVMATVDISGRNTTASTSVDLRTRDASSLVISGVQTTPARVSVTVRLRTVDSVTVPVVPVVGSVPAGYEVASISARPVTVTLTGPASQLSGVDAVQTAPIAVKSRGQSTVTVSLRVPSGLSTLGSSTAVVTVSVRRVGERPRASEAPEVQAETSPPAVETPAAHSTPAEAPDTPGADRPASPPAEEQPNEPEPDTDAAPARRPGPGHSGASQPDTTHPPKPPRTTRPPRTAPAS